MYSFEENMLVYVYTRPNLRDDNLEMEMFMGRDVLDDIFTNMKMRLDVKSLFLSFPEHWLNIIEQRCLYERLTKYCPNLKTLTIKTHSVYIIQCTRNNRIRMVDNPEGIQEDSNRDKKLFIEMTGNLFNMNSLNVVNADGITNL